MNGNEQTAIRFFNLRHALGEKGAYYGGSAGGVYVLLKARYSVQVFAWIFATSLLLQSPAKRGILTPIFIEDVVLLEDQYFCP